MRKTIDGVAIGELTIVNELDGVLIKRSTVEEGDENPRITVLHIRKRCSGSLRVGYRPCVGSNLGVLRGAG